MGPQVGSWVLSRHRMRNCPGLAVKWGRGAQLRPAAVQRFCSPVPEFVLCKQLLLSHASDESVSLLVQVIALAPDLANIVATSAHYNFNPSLGKSQC